MFFGDEAIFFVMKQPAQVDYSVEYLLKYEFKSETHTARVQQFGAVRIDQKCFVNFVWYIRNTMNSC
jgi:hypothetical protein